MKRVIMRCVIMRLKCSCLHSKLEQRVERRMALVVMFLVFLKLFFLLLLHDVEAIFHLP